MTRRERERPIAEGALALAVALLVVAACGKPDSAPGIEPWFEDVAAESGLDFLHVQDPEIRYWNPESLCGGAALFDADGDGDLDAYLVQGGDLAGAGPDTPGNRLFRNRGDGRFEDVTQAAGVGDRGYGMGAACADYDGDGDVDLYVTNLGPNVLYRNEGDGRFTDVTATSGTGDPSWSSSAAFVDYDGDGDLDLYVANYAHWSAEAEATCLNPGGSRTYCGPTFYPAALDTLYRNEGDGTFTNVSEPAGIWQRIGRGLGVALGDYDGDGRVDIYVANDGTENQLWHSLGDGTFRDDALWTGTAVNADGMAEAGMGVISFDLENDGDLDLFMTHLRAETNTLYVNQGGRFQDATAVKGLAAASFSYTGFGVGYADFDHDGNGDLYVANGRVTVEVPAAPGENPYAETNLVFVGRPDSTFEVFPLAGGTRQPLLGVSRAAALGDVDADGDVDIVVVEAGGQARLLRNLAGSVRGSWVMLRCVESGRDALGATVRLDAGGRRQYRTLQVSNGYLSSNDPRVHFGLDGAETVDEIEVRWPGGAVETFGPVPARRLHVLRRGEGRAGN